MKHELLPVIPVIPESGRRIESRGKPIVGSSNYPVIPIKGRRPYLPKWIL